MSPIALRAQMRRWRHHAALLALLLALVGFIAVHHAAPAIGDAHHDSDMAVAAMCLGAFTAVGAAVVAVALGLIELGRWRPAVLLAPAGVLWAARPPQARTRAGPALLVLLCVSRR